MAEHEPKGIIQRFLHGGRSPFDLGLAHEEKGLHPYDPNQRWIDWSSPSLPMHSYGTYGSSIDYTVAVGDIPDASVVMVCINWLMRNFPKSQPRVVIDKGDGLKPVVGHKLTALLKRPNPYYTGTRLWEGTALSYYWTGEAYWRLVRNGAGQIIEMYYEPHWTIRPVRHNSNEFVSGFEVWRDHKWQPTPREDVVHFPFGFSPHQQMQGMGPLASVLREIYGDNQAARMTANLLRNFGVYSVFFSPTDVDAPLTQTEMVRLIAEYQAATTGENIGRAVASNKPVAMTRGEVDLTKMNLRENRKIFEERVSAALGLSAQVVGLGAGLDRNILGSPEEALRWTYDNNIVPTQNSMAEVLDLQLLSQFTSIEAETIEFDQSNISVLKGDKQKEEASTALLWNSDAITLAQKNVRLGYEPPTDETADMVKSQLFAKANPFAPPPPPPQDEDDVPQDASTAPTDDEKALASMVALNGHGGRH